MSGTYTCRGFVNGQLQSITNTYVGNARKDLAIAIAKSARRYQMTNVYIVILIDDVVGRRVYEIPYTTN